MYRVYLFTGLDYRTGILDWTNGLSYFPLLDKCLVFTFRKKTRYTFLVNKYLATMDDCNNSCLL